MEYYTGVFKKYAVFTGRARRKEYWMFVLFNVIVSIVISLIGSAMNTRLLSDLYALAVFIPSLAVAIRRLHDTGRSGWWLLLAFIPLIGIIVLVVFQASDSQPGMNQYGPNPKEATAPSA